MCRIHAKGWLHVAAMATAIELALKVDIVLVGVGMQAILARSMLQGVPLT